MHNRDGKLPNINRADKSKHLCLFFLRYAIYSHRCRQKAAELALQREMNITFASHIVTHKSCRADFHFVKVTFAVIGEICSENLL